MKKILLAFLLGALAISGDAKYTQGQLLTAAELSAPLAATQLNTPSSTRAGATTTLKQLGHSISVLDFGADPTGIADSTIAIQNAINTGNTVHINQGTYKISFQLNFLKKGQVVFGDGRGTTFLSITGPSAGFVVGILNINTGEVGPELSDFCVALTQPDTNIRANLNEYPPVIYINASPRTRLTNLRLVGGLDGVYQNGNDGGSTYTNIESGNFRRNWYTDGNADLTTWTDCEVWPFSATGSMTVKQQAIFAEPSTYGFYSLRSDYFKWTGGLLLAGTNAYFGTGRDGTTYGTFSQTGFDTFGGLKVEAGEIQAINCIFSVGGTLNGATNSVNNAATHTGGMLNISGGNVFVGTSSAIANNAIFYSNSPSGGGLTVNNVDISLGNIDVSAVSVSSADKGEIRIIGVGLNRIGKGSYTAPILDIQGGFGVISNNPIFPNTLVSGNTNWLSMADDVVYKVSGNSNYNWSTSIAGTTVASSAQLTIPPVFGDVMPVIQVTGTTTIDRMMYDIVGVEPPYAGAIVTLQFAGASTVVSGSVGSAGAFILNGRSNFIPTANSTLTVQLMANGNWQEIGRCA
jgi:hypothetical protein